MVGVVIDVCVPVAAEMDVYPSFNPLERSEGGPDDGCGDSVTQGGCRSGYGVFHIHPAGDAHRAVLDASARMVQRELEAAVGQMADVARIEVAGLVEGISVNAGLDAVQRQVHPVFQDKGAVGGNLGCELSEGFHHALIVAVYVEMVGIDGGYHSGLRVELQEGAVELVGLHNHCVGV